MAKAPQNEKPITSADIEFHVDAWTRFGRAVDAAVKSGPKHKAKKKTVKKKKVPRKSKKRAND
jgi:hypothetical protein